MVGDKIESDEEKQNEMSKMKWKQKQNGTMQCYPFIINRPLCPLLINITASPWNKKEVIATVILLSSHEVDESEV